LSGALTLEAWLAPTDLTLGGPARIVSLSDGWHDRNLTLGQGDGAGGTDFYDLRLRSTATNANGYPSTTTPAGSLEAGLQHVVATRSADDWIRLYIDDRLVTSRRRTGSLAGWDSAYPLLLGNETTGDRPWLGELHLVAIYDRALDSGEITQNYYAGPPTAGGGSPPDPEPGDDPDLPAPEIGPQAAILLEAGQSHQFTASWPPGTPEELVNAPLIWTSADPAIATVDANGLVHMHTDKALAVITAHADAATPHLPGFGSVTSGAVVRPGARILPAEDLLSQSLIDVEEGSLEFVVAANSGTSTLQVGDLASFGDRGALVIDSIGSVAEGLRLSGTVPTLEDGFEELNIRVDEAANRVLWGVLQDAQGLNEPQANSLERSHGRDAGVDCALKAVTTYGIDPSTDFEIRLSGGKITKFALLADLGLELAMEQLSIDLEFECEVEVANIFLSLVPSPPPIPLWYKFSYPITVGGGFTFNPAVDSVVGPGLELYQQLSAGLEVTDGTPDFSMDSDTPQPAFLIGDAVQDFAASIDATFGAFAKIEAGVVRLGLLVLPTRDPFIELDVGVLEVRAGVEATIPATGRLLPSPNYRNPELDGVVTIDLKGLKVQTGPDVNRVLEWIGSSGVQTSFLGLRIFETRYPFPIPLAPTFAPDTVYLQSADPSQLPFSFATIEQEVPWPSWLPQPLDYFEVWGRPAGTDDNFQFLWQLDENQGSIIPTPEHEGTWVTRTVGYYTFNDWIPRILAGQPVVSPNTEVITVRDRSAMVIEGTEALESIIQGVNSVHSTTVTVGNVDITPLDYE
ncbi:MAG: LamG-like jellyroll fold domain-containing protein, partial [Acidobacteriota bacterium]